MQIVRFWSCELILHYFLFSNAMKNNLQHPNEYIRGSTLRFICTLKEAEILESLIPAITENLEHRHSYVRKNAALAVYSVFEAHPDLLPDGPELIEKFLLNEANAACKRNAFLMLCNCDQERAVRYLASIMDSISSAVPLLLLPSLPYCLCCFFCVLPTSCASHFLPLPTPLHASWLPLAVCLTG